MSTTFENYTAENFNLYKSFNKSLDTAEGFILKYFQTIPKYYLIDSGIRTLICDYGLGSGKTSTAIFIASYYLKKLNKIRFSDVQKQPNKILVLGSWVSIEAFKRDLLRPEFHIVSESEINEIKTKLKSQFKEVREEGKQKQKQLEKRIDNAFMFKNLQAIFNMAFPNLNEQKYIQHIDSLLQGWENGELKINQDFLNSVRNTIIIIDECQRLWSQEGMNTYGFVIGALIKKSVEYNIHFVFLSGTIINSNISELADIYNVMNLERFYDRNEFLEDKTVLGNIHIKTLRDDVKTKLYKFFYDKFLFYSQNSNSKIKFIDYIDPIESAFKLSKLDTTITSDENLKCMHVIQVDKSLPDVYHLGNIVIKNESQSMVLYNVNMIGYQKQKYEAELLKKESTEINELEEQTSTNIRDGIFDPKDTSIYYSNGVYTGKGLEYNNLRQYSAIGAELVRICIYNTLRNEKVIVYHDKIANFGLKQYIEILKINGYIEYGGTAQSYTRCSKCGHQLQNHANKNHPFVPMCYAAIHGDVIESERKKLTELYNSPNNIDGEIINVMFISVVAYVGVSFYNTTNLVILNKISGISKWKQICGRIVRTGSHSLLPQEKHIAKIYTMIVDDEIEHKEQKYYKLNVLLNNEIQTITEHLTENSITNDLFEGTIEPQKNETKNIFINDLKHELGIVVKKIPMTPWTKEGFIKRIKSINSALSYIDYSKFDDSFINSILLLNSMVKIFRYKNTQTEYYELLHNTIETAQRKGVIIKFTDFDTIKIPQFNLKIGVNDLNEFVKGDNIITIRNQLIKLLKLLNKNPSQLIGQSSFWEAMFKIHNEYYDDDDTNFVKNHSTQGRDFSKMSGCYFGNEILKKDGTTLKLYKIKKDAAKWDNIPFGFKITSFNDNSGLLWYLRVLIVDYNDHEDRRKINTGINCSSFKIERIIHYFPDLQYDENKKITCISLLEILCNYALEHNVELINPFSE